MLNSIFLFVLKLNNKSVSDGNYFLVVVELVATVMAFAIFRNT